MTDSKIDISGGDNTIINNQPGAAVIIGNISDSQAQQVLVPFAKLSKGETVSMEVLIKICKVLNCDIGDVIELIPKEN